MEQTEMRQDLTNWVTVYKNVILNNAGFFKRFFFTISYDIVLIFGIVEFVVIGAKAYDAAWGLTEQQIYGFIFWACMSVAAILFIMLIVFNFKILLKQGNTQNKIKKETM